VTPAGSVLEYRAAPVGHYLAGRSFFHFFARRDLAGMVLWGIPDLADAQAMTAALDAEVPGCAPMHTSFVDARRLVAADPVAFEVAIDYFRRRSPALGSNVTRHALVRPAGVVGAIVAGFWNVAPAAHPDRTCVFADALEAMAWLGCVDGTAVLDELDRIQASISGIPRVVQALRDYATNHPRASLAEVARVVGVSSRSLQERLHAAGTTFRHELNSARVRAAQALLATSHTKLEVIAAEVGCASIQHFSTLFRRETGESPSAWRARHRDGARPPG
jgi:AraC-like DNA-binding protein